MSLPRISKSSPLTNVSVGLLRFSGALLLAGASTLLSAAVPNLVLNSNGQIFYASNGRIYRIDTQLQRVEQVSRAQGISRLQVDANREVYGRGLAYDPKLDLYRPTVWRVMPGDETTSSRIARPAAGDFEFSEVGDRDGNLYFWQHDPKRQTSRIVMRARTGGLRLVAGHKLGHADGRGADARLGLIGSMTVAEDGTLYFTDHESVRRVDPNGHVTTIARGGLLALGSGRQPENHLCALTLASDGALFVTDRVTRRILRVAPDGTITGFAYSPDEWVPVSLHWSGGALYVLEISGDGARTMRYLGDGTAIELKPLQESRRPVGEQRPLWLG